jgi:protein CpxP
LRFFALRWLDLLAINQEDKQMSKLNTFFKTTLTPIAFCITLTTAAPAMAKKNHHQRHDGMRQILSQLSLTDIQKQDIQQILKQTREDRGLFKVDAKSLKTQLRSLVQSTGWDQVAIENTITQRQVFIQEQALQRAHNKNQVWNLLTEMQQTDFVALLDPLKADLNVPKTGLETHKIERKEKGVERRKKSNRKGNKLKGLGLSEVQLTAVKVIKTQAKTSGEEIKANLKSYKQEERTLVHNKTFDAQAWQILHSQYQADFLAMAVLKAKTKHHIWNQLTAEQQVKAQKPNKHKGKAKNPEHKQTKTV